MSVLLMQYVDHWVMISPFKWQFRVYDSGVILGLRPANDRRRYFVTTSRNGWVQA